MDQFLIEDASKCVRNGCSEGAEDTQQLTLTSFVHAHHPKSMQQLINDKNRSLPS